MYSNISIRLNKALELSREIAVKMGQTSVFPEHFLLGLIRLSEGTAYSIMRKLGANFISIKKDLVLSLKREEIVVKLGVLPISHEGDRVLSIAQNEATETATEIVGTEHMLLALTKSTMTKVGKVLMRHGITYSEVKTTLRNLLDGNIHQSKSFSEDSNMNSSSVTIESETPAIDSFSRDVTQAARENKLDPVIGREHEIDRVIQILSRRKKNNPVLIGEPGTGKTAIVEALALRIVGKKVPSSLHNKRLVALDLGLIIAGTKYRGQFEERIKAILAEVDKNPNIILFLDEIHTIVGAGSTTGSIDASNMFKPALARGELQCIGATTLDEYRTTIEKDGALERRFQKIIVDPPSPAESLQILKALKDSYEQHHKVRYSDESLEACVRMATRYITDRFLPDKAIDIMDEAGAKKHLSLKMPRKVKEYEEKIKDADIQKNDLIEKQDFEKAAEVRDLITELRDKLNEELDSWNNFYERQYVEITEEDIAEVVAGITGIPVSRLAASESKRLNSLEKTMMKQIISQDDAIKAVVRRIKRARTGFKDPKRPIGSFLFLGPTGVGKTELAKVLARELFETEDSLIKIDMSEYIEKFNVSRMIGSPPGYVGYDEGGQLSEKVRRKPYSVVLFDEIEKAHPEVYGMLLQVLDEGVLTDGNGRKIDFKNTVIIFTSNIGTGQITKTDGIGFGIKDDAETKQKQINARINDGIQKFFKPEFLNRLDEILIFNYLSKEAIERIVGGNIKIVQKHLKEHNIELEITPAVKKYITEKYYDSEKGARPIRRAIENEIEDKIAEGILSGEFNYGQVVKVSVKNKQLVFTTREIITEQEKSKKMLDKAK